MEEENLKSYNFKTLIVYDVDNSKTDSNPKSTVGNFVTSYSWMCSI